MSGTASILEYKKPLDSSGIARSPYDGLPLQLVAEIGDNSPSGILGVQIAYFNHFHRWEGPVAEGSAGGWTLSGVTGAATVVLTNTTHGEITITADGTANCDPTLQLGSASLGADFVYVAGKRLWVHARLAIGTVASTEMLFGIATPDTEPTVTNTFPSDGIFFEKAASATKFDFHARKDGTSTERTLIGNTLVDATFITVGFVVNARGDIIPYQNGSAISAGVIPAGTANIPSAAADVMQLMIGFRGASQTVKLDWLLAAQER